MKSPPELPLRSGRRPWRSSAGSKADSAVALGTPPARPLLAALALLAAIAGASEATASDLHDRIADRLTALRDELIEIRRDIHRHPEISGEEERTAALVAQRLRTLGFEVRTEIGGHGVIGLLRGARPGPVVAYRADMDAVRSNAPDPVEFRSVDPGKRHICGHDLHTTIALALADGFAAVRDELPGAIQLIFQPAEENATGARAMLADGVFAKTRPVAVYAVHTAPLEAGQITAMPGEMMAGRDRVTVTVKGGGDLAQAVKEVRQAIQGVGTLSMAQAMQPQQGDFIYAQVRVTDDDGSGERSVIGTLTTLTREASRQAAASLGERLAALELPGVEIEHHYQERLIAGVTNDPELTSRAIASARSVLGEDSVLSLDSVIPLFSEDFGSFQEEVPGVMFFLGVSNSQQGWVGMPHSPRYVADEEAIFVGARTMAKVILDRMVAH